MARDSVLGRLLQAALDEDVGPGDFTTLWTVDPSSRARATIVAKEAAVVAGTTVLQAVYGLLDRDVDVTVLAADGSRVEAGSRVVELEGPAGALLTGERVALNFLGHLSGVATLTSRYVDAIEGTGTRVVDTRKTTPGLRALEKDAVRAGGGSNHRLGLFDMVLIKENHIAAAGGIRGAVEAVRRRNTRGLAVEVEVTNEEELDEALEVGVDRVLLDNMSREQVAALVPRIRALGTSAPEIEASGNMSLETIRGYAEAGVDLISVGALTHSARTADFSMRIER